MFLQGYGEVLTSKHNKESMFDITGCIHRSTCVYYVIKSLHAESDNTTHTIYT